MYITPPQRGNLRSEQHSQPCNRDSVEIDPTNEKVKRQLKKLGKTAGDSLEETLKDQFFTAINSEKFIDFTHQSSISPRKISPCSNISGRTSHSIQESPYSTIDENFSSTPVVPLRIPRSHSVTTSSSSINTTPVAPLLTFLQEKRLSLSHSLEELTQKFSEVPENLVQLYEKAYQVQKLTSRTQSLKDMAQNVQDSNEKNILMKEYEEILAELSIYAKKYNYKNLALHRVRNQLYHQKSRPTDILLPPGDGKLGLEKKILLAENYSMFHFLEPKLLLVRYF